MSVGCRRASAPRARRLSGSATQKGAPVGTSARRVPPASTRRAPSAPADEPLPENPAVGGSGHAELVALRVAQHDGTAPHVIGLPGEAGACLHQLLNLLADQSLALLATDLVAGHPDVEVDAVLGHLALGHPLEVQAGPYVRRIDHRRLVAE